MTRKATETEKGDMVSAGQKVCVVDQNFEQKKRIAVAKLVWQIALFIRFHEEIRSGTVTVRRFAHSRRFAHFLLLFFGDVTFFLFALFLCVSS